MEDCKCTAANRARTASAEESDAGTLDTDKKQAGDNSAAADNFMYSWVALVVTMVAAAVMLKF